MTFGKPRTSGHFQETINKLENELLSIDKRDIRYFVVRSNIKRYKEYQFAEEATGLSVISS